MINRRAVPLIYFSFFADLTFAYLAQPNYFFFRGRLAACTKFKSDRPTETINPVNVDYSIFHLWAFSHLFLVYMAVSLLTYCMMKPIFIWKTVVSARGLNHI